MVCAVEVCAEEVVFVEKQKRSDFLRDCMAMARDIHGYLLHARFLPANMFRCFVAVFCITSDY